MFSQTGSLIVWFILGLDNGLVLMTWGLVVLGNNMSKARPCTTTSNLYVHHNDYYVLLAFILQLAIVLRELQPNKPMPFVHYVHPPCMHIGLTFRQPQFPIEPASFDGVSPKKTISCTLTTDIPVAENETYTIPVCSQSDDNIDILTECVWHIVRDDLTRDVPKSLVCGIVAEARVRSIDTLVNSVRVQREYKITFILI